MAARIETSRVVVAVLGVVAVAMAALLWPRKEPCLVEDLGVRLGRDHLLVGGSMTGPVFVEEPFDLRYQYIAGGIPNEECADCQACAVGAVSCANPFSCGWWGCWQRDDLPPGAFVRRFLDDTEQRGAVPMFTYYEWYWMAGEVEEHAEIAALQDPALVARYLADFRRFVFLLGEEAHGPVIVHLEPDLWAFGRKVDADPARIPVALGAAGMPECVGLPDDLSGLARCLAAMARAGIPQAVVALHASAWDDRADALLETDPAFDAAAHGRATGRWLADLGAEPDLLVVEMNHRDAGYNGAWWDPDDAGHPSFSQALTWAAALSREADAPHLWWQVPYGHAGLPDTCGQYRDNRLDWFFEHADRFADGTTLGIAFGAGTECMTTPETDGGHFLDRAKAWYAGARPPLCAP